MKRGGLDNNTREAMAYLRLRAVKLRKDGWKVIAIAEVFDVHENTVSRWLGNERKKGLSSLYPTRAIGRESKLSKTDKKKILSWLKMSALDFSFETPLWTGRKIAQLIKMKLGNHY